MNTAAELDAANALRRLGRHKAAAEICQRILKRHPNHFGALLVLGAIADDLGDARSALGFLARVVDRKSGMPGAAVLLGDVLVTLGSAEGAVAWYRTALALDCDVMRAGQAIAGLLTTPSGIDETCRLAEDQLARDRPHLAAEMARIGRTHASGHPGLALVEGLGLLALGAEHLPHARTCLRAALAAAPDDARILAALGKAFDEHPLWLARAAASAPSVATHAALAEALCRQSRPAEARRAVDRALAIDAEHGAAQRALIKVHLALGELETCIGLARRRLGAGHDADITRLLAEALVRRGLATSALALAQAAEKAGNRADAIAAAEGIVAAAPDLIDAWRLLRTPLADREILLRSPSDAKAMAGAADGMDDSAGRRWLARAIAIDAAPAAHLALAQSLARSGDRPGAWRLLDPLAARFHLLERGEAISLARLLIDTGRAREALPVLELLGGSSLDDDAPLLEMVRAHAALENAPALIQLGIFASRRPRLDVSLAAFTAGRRLQPDRADLAYLLAQTHHQAEDRDPAIDAFADAAELAGEQNADLMTKAAQFLVDIGAVDLGLSYLSRAMALDFENAAHHTYSYFFNFLNLCDWPARAAYIQRLTALGESRIAADDPTFQLNPSLWVFLGAERDLLYRSANHFARHSFPPSPPRPPATGGGDPDRPIRIGYLSAFLYRYHIGHSLIGILRAHDRREVNVHLYSFAVDDELQRELKHLASGFRAVDDKPPDTIARMIAADGIDILVDLDGYVNGSGSLRPLEVASHRAAPIQMLYHNYVGPTGTDFVDYVVADRELFEAHDDQGYRERLIRLPPCYYPTPALDKAGDGGSRRSWGLPEDGVVFCNFGHFYKVEPGCFDVWMRILRRVPGSVIWMNHWNSQTAVENLRREAEARGIDPARLVFSAPVDKPVHIGRIGLADLFLDTLIYASGVTSLDVLWGGVPVLTVRGNNFARRVGASLNAGIGLEDLTCVDAASYEELAVALATDPARLQAVKARLKVNLTTEPLFDPARLARNLERAYRVAFQRHQQGLPPESFELAP
jgi:protein O-GlcNAc transferase